MKALHSRTARIVLLTTSVASVACSALAVREADCQSDEQCEDAFGPDFVCGPEGTCEAPAGTSSGGDETGVGTEACPDDVCTVALADECSDDDVPLFESNDDFVIVETVGLSNDFDELSCLETAPNGNDGFFALDLSAGERWHFHVRVTDDAANPAVYVLRNCDERACQKGDGLDLCGDGVDEHMSFTAREAGRYYVAVDGRNSGGTAYELLAIRPTCGNGGMPEHSETCDDGNTTPLDGCDGMCRAEVTAAAADEAEPNDDRAGANVLLLDEQTQSISVRGTGGGRCDFDNFVVTVPDGASVRTTLQAAGGQDCGGSTPPFTLLLLEDDAQTVLGEGAPRGQNACPSFDETDVFASNLPGGTYYIRVFTGEDQAAFDYALRVEVVTE